MSADGGVPVTAALAQDSAKDAKGVAAALDPSSARGTANVLRETMV